MKSAAYPLSRGMTGAAQFVWNSHRKNKMRALEDINTLTLIRLTLYLSHFFGWIDWKLMSYNMVYIEFQFQVLCFCMFFALILLFYHFFYVPFFIYWSLRFSIVFVYMMYAVSLCFLISKGHFDIIGMLSHFNTIKV